MAVIDFGAARAAREPKPDAAHVYRDEKGELYYEFTCSFEGDGEIWGFSLWARNWDEAERKLGQMKATGKIDGQIYSTVDA